MAPVVVAAAVAMIATGTTVLLPRLLTSRQHQGPPSGAAAGASVPKFFVEVVDIHPGSGNATRLEVVATATGRVVGSLAPPTAARSFRAVAPLGNNQTFVVAESGLRCDTWLYQFRLSAQGQPTGLAPLVVPDVPGRMGALEVDPVPLAASANGAVVAFSTLRCSNPLPRTYTGQVGAFDLATRTVTTWKFRAPYAPVNLSLSANGSLLELRVPGDSVSVLRTDSVAGWLAQRYRRVFGPSVTAGSPVLSPDGRVTFAVVSVRAKRPVWWQAALRAYRTASGRLIRQILTLPGFRHGVSVSADPSGRYLLAFFQDSRVQWVNLATGRLNTIKQYPAVLLDAAW